MSCILSLVLICKIKLDILWSRTAVFTKFCFHQFFFLAQKLKKRKCFWWGRHHFLDFELVETLQAEFRFFDYHVFIACLLSFFWACLRIPEMLNKTKDFKVKSHISVIRMYGTNLQKDKNLSRILPKVEIFKLL